MVVDAIKVIIMGDAPILSRLTELEELLLKEHLMNELNVVSSRLRTHYKNRSRLGVNPHEVHRLGLRVSKIGFKLDELDIYVIETVVLNLGEQGMPVHRDRRYTICVRKDFFHCASIGVGRFLPATQM